MDELIEKYIRAKAEIVDKNAANPKSKCLSCGNIWKTGRPVSFLTGY